MIFPATRLSLSGERFTVHYRLAAGGEAEARALGPRHLPGADGRGVRRTPGRRRHPRPRGRAHRGAGSRVGPGRYDAAISYAVETTAGELTQLLNVIFGNSAMQPGIRVLHLDLPPSLLQQFKGPRFGREGLRALLGVADRPLLGTALKPMGLRAADLADLAYQLALGGVDIIKEDHGLTDQPFAPFAERVPRCAEAVDGPIAQTGYRCLYAPNVTAPADRILHPCPAGQGLGVRAASWWRRAWPAGTPCAAGRGRPGPAHLEPSGRGWGPSPSARSRGWRIMSSSASCRGWPAPTPRSS